MRTREKDKKNLIQVGIFFAGLTLILMIMIASIGKENSIFEPKIDIKARVDNVSNLKPGSYVELKGIRVGSVTSVDIISEDEVEITMNILEKELKWIKEDSKVSISTAGLVGDKFVEIFKGSKDAETFNPTKHFLQSDGQSSIKSMMNKGESIATVTDRILTKLDNILISLGDGQSVVGTLHSLNRASNNMEKITNELKEAKLGQMVGNVNKASASFSKILTRIEHGPGSMNSLIYDDGVHDDLRALLGGAQRNKVIKYFIRDSIKKSEERKSK